MGLLFEGQSQDARAVARRPLPNRLQPRQTGPASSAAINILEEWWQPVADNVTANSLFFASPCVKDDKPPLYQMTFGTDYLQKQAYQQADILGTSISQFNFQGIVHATGNTLPVLTNPVQISYLSIDDTASNDLTYFDNKEWVVDPSGKCATFTYTYDIHHAKFRQDGVLVFGRMMWLNLRFEASVLITSAQALTNATTGGPTGSNTAPQTTSTTPPSVGGGSNKISPGVIAAAAIVSLLFVVLAFAVFFILRRRRRRKLEQDTEDTQPTPFNAPEESSLSSPATTTARGYQMRYNGDRKSAPLVMLAPGESPPSSSSDPTAALSVTSLSTTEVSSPPSNTTVAAASSSAPRPLPSLPTEATSSRPPEGAITFEQFYTAMQGAGLTPDALVARLQHRPESADYAASDLPRYEPATRDGQHGPR